MPSTDLRDQLNAIDKCWGNFSSWDWVLDCIISLLNKSSRGTNACAHVHSNVTVAGVLFP